MVIILDKVFLAALESIAQSLLGARGSINQALDGLEDLLEMIRFSENKGEGEHEHESEGKQK